MDIYELRVTLLRALIATNSLKDFANAHDVDASYLSQLLNGHRRLGDRAAGNLEQKLGLPSGLLVTGRYTVEDLPAIKQKWDSVGLDRPVLPHPVFFNMNITETAQRVADDQAAQQHRHELRQRMIPVVGKAMLGTNGYFDAMEFPTGHGDGYLDVRSDDENAYALRVVGNSMHPRIKSGELVLIEPNHPFLNGDEVLVKTRDGKCMIKEFIYLRDGQYRFDSVNSEYPPVFLDESEVEKIHYVAGIIKSSKYLDLPH
ncbi:TPA: helix-turn-helix transcriptional regulator [Pseudomonas aeruginosa]|uniref:S24 family peptidase n=1 Tax=Pseudomonas aeruginosa TaxID=287 RepID=UPI002358495D|nr:S24 family peptidase [Pseudomonas aeruginosa]